MTKKTKIISSKQRDLSMSYIIIGVQLFGLGLVFIEATNG